MKVCLLNLLVFFSVLSVSGQTESKTTEEIIKQGNHWTMTSYLKKNSISGAFEETHQWAVDYIFKSDNTYNYTVESFPQTFQGTWKIEPETHSLILADNSNPGNVRTYKIGEISSEKWVLIQNEGEPYEARITFVPVP